MLIAPAVVAFFHKDIPSREILAVLPSYFEEHKLDEFETFLHQVPGQKNDQDADINWETIYEPLKVVASAVVLQRYQWSQGILKISDQYSLAPPSSMLSYDRGPYPVASPHQTVLPPMHANDLKTFDIVVSPEGTGQTMSPVQVNSSSGTAPGKTGMKPYIPVIVGVAVILIIIFAGIFFSGYLNHPVVANTTNSTSVTIIQSTTVKPATTTAPTAKPTTAITTQTPVPTPKSYSSAEIGNHLLEIGFGPNNNVVKKPTKNLLVVSLDGMYNKPDVALVNNFINQFNNYSSTTKLSENINFNTPADIALDFQPATNIIQINTTFDYKDPQTGTQYFALTRETAAINSDLREKTYVNSDLKGDERKRWILRAILYNLGFYGETAKYPDSIFYAGATNSSQLSDIDLKALQLMYGNKITNGMTKDTMRTYIL
jgi:hypothetical protein